MFGSNGLVGRAVTKVFASNKSLNVFSSTRADTDLFSYSQTQNKIREIEPNLIINAAARVGGIYANNTKRTEFILENLKINMNILEASIENPEIKIINLGSSCIYPLNAENPIKEESFMDGKLEPTNSPYAMAKLSSIELGRSISNQYGHKIINLMPTNLYGPYDFFAEKDSHVIPGLIYRMHNAKSSKQEVFKIWGSGKPLREFLYVEDLAKAILFIVENNIEIDLINIGSNEEVSIKELGFILKDIIQYKGEINFDTSKPDGNPRKLLDSSIINSHGWKSTVNLEEGLIRTYSWFEENIA
ncbi:GDP-L-fucose synthase [Acidimicrobiaceae bacterium]|nr:GDP-L-fucose synthase [Acidimicrobiaceae bacterium]